jgi:predicted small secreted protein
MVAATAIRRCFLKETKMNKSIKFVIAGLLFASLGLAACNTTAGVGKDIENTGDAIKDTANDAK